MHREDRWQAIAAVGNASAPPSPGTFRAITLACLEEFGVQRPHSLLKLLLSQHL